MNKRILQSNYLILILVLGVAAFFRFYQIDRIPPGLFPDEATHALDAMEVLGGQFTLYSPDEGSTGSLWRYLLALQFALFGPSILSLRIFAAVIGLLSVGMAYLLVRELALTPLGGSTEPVTAGGRVSLSWPWWPELIAALSALLLAV